MVRLKTAEEIELMRQGGAVLAGALKAARQVIAVGTTLKEIDMVVETYIRAYGGEPAFLDYKPYGAKAAYPASVCTSVNTVVVHGLPNEYVLREGDIVTVDVGVRYRGLITDAAETFSVGVIGSRTKHLLYVTQKALAEAIKKAKPGLRLGDIGYAIEMVAKAGGVSVIDLLTGHGVGYNLHEEPTVYNYGAKNTGIKLKPGMTIAIEPMFALGGSEIRQTEDDEYVMADGSLSAHFEHTVAITEQGNVVLTKTET